MARCGRCGLCAKSPDDNEGEWGGVCLWFRHRIAKDEMYDHSDCEEFLEAIPGFSVLDHWHYKLQRDKLHDAYQAAEAATRKAHASMTLAIISLIISGLGVALKVLTTFWPG